MKTLNIIFSGLCYATLLATTAHANNCDNIIYRKYNPSKCAGTSMSFAATGATIGLGSALVGGALALAGGLSSGGGGGATTQSAAPVMPTLPVYNLVGGDVDSAHLASIANNSLYNKNFNQYNEIRLNYSLARGFTGKNSTIAILDAGDDTWHGKTVAAIARGPIAPDATVNTYKIVDNNMDFLPYAQIGEVIKSAGDANIFNSSWSVQMRADQVHSRAQMIAITDANFINQMVAAAERDAIFVWAAGNDYDKQQSSALSAIPRVVSELRGHFINVVAWDDETGTLAQFSNACGVTKDYCITAPGTNISVGYSNANGTSFAAPIVSAATAVLREAYPYMTAEQITNLLFETARDLGAPGVDEIYGHGMLDLERATRPVGAPLVTISENVVQPLSTARVSGDIGRQIKSADIKFASFDNYGRPFESNLNDNITIKNRGRGFEHLRAETRSMSAGKFEIGFKKSDFLRTDGFLKSNDPRTTITFVGYANSFQINDVEIFHNMSIGSSKPDTSADSVVTKFSNIYTASATFGAKYGEWSASIAIPDAIISGTMEMRMADGRAQSGNIIWRNYEIDLASRPAIEYAVTYKFLTAAFVDNPYGTDEFYILAKSKLRF